MRVLVDLGFIWLARDRARVTLHLLTSILIVRDEENPLAAVVLAGLRTTLLSMITKSQQHDKQVAE